MADFNEAYVAGQNAADWRVLPGGGTYAAVPEGSQIQDLEPFLPAPIRARASVTAKSAETFQSYVNRFKSAATVVFADQEKFTLVGIIDYHAVDAPAFREHRVTYTAPRSQEWATWKGANGRAMAQADFAKFIEDNVVDIRDPAGADVLEVARSLQAKNKVEFASAIRLSNGEQQFTYSETVEGSSRNGTLKVPETFTLGIPVFFGGIAYEVQARLRYRIKEGALSLWYDLYRPEYIEKDAFEAVVTDVGTATGIEIWYGTP